MEKVLKFYLSNTDTYKHRSLYEYIAYQAKQNGIEGVTVYQGVMGYGSTGRLSSNKFWEINVKYPVVIEMIDNEQTLQKFIDGILPVINSQPKGCLITMQAVDIVLRKKGENKIK